MRVPRPLEALHRYTGGRGLGAQLRRGGLASLGVKAAAAVLQVGVTIVLARTLGADGYGVYAFVFALVTLLAIPAQAGLPHLVVRETARAHAEEAWDRMKGVWGWSATMVGYLSGFLVLLALGGMLLLPPTEPRWTATLTWGLLLVPLIGLLNLQGAALRGLHLVIRGQVPEVLLRPGFFLVVIVVVAIVPLLAPTPAVAMAAHALAAGLALLVASNLLKRHTPPPARDVPGAWMDWRAWLTSALPLGLIAGMQVISSNTDLVMLGLFRSEAEVGIYRVAVQAAGLVTFALGAVNMIVSPHMARLHTRGEHDRLQEVVTEATRFALFVAVPITLVLVLFGGAILQFVVGAEFEAGATPLMLLAVGQLLNAAFGSVAVLLNMTGHEWETAKGVGVGAVANVVLNLALIPLLGMMGAAVATLVTLGLWNLILWRAVKVRLGLNSLALGRPGLRTRGDSDDG